MLLLSLEMTIKVALAEIRIKRGYTQESLADALAVKVGRIRALEQERIVNLNLPLLDRICEILSCEIYEILIRVPNESSYK